MKTMINPGFQLVRWLRGRQEDNKLCSCLRTVDAPIKSWLYGLLTHTIAAFTALLIFYPHFVSNGLQLSQCFNEALQSRQAKDFFVCGLSQDSKSETDIKPTFKHSLNTQKFTCI